MAELSPDAVREIERIHSSWIAFEVAGEDHKLIMLCADDIELWPPDEQPVAGLAAVSALMAHGETRIHSIETTDRRIQDCSLYIVPLRKNGQRMDLADEDGQILEDFMMELPEPSVAANSSGPMRLAFPGKTAGASGEN